MPLPSISQLYLAYRQAKSALYFERRGVGLIQLAKFEDDLPRNLTQLRSTLRCNGGWFDDLSVGEIWMVPKRLRKNVEEDENVIRIGPRSTESSQGLDVQIRLSPTPAFAIVEVLFLWQFGPLLDALLSPSVLGYRLDLRGGKIATNRRWLFEFWPRRYEQFRSAPLKAAQAQLRLSGGSVVIVSADLASYYDTVDPSFMTHDSFVADLRFGGASEPADVVQARYRIAARSLLASYARFREKAARLTGFSWPIGIPIGALTSRVVANAALITLDRAIAAHSDVLCYRRYVDDLVIVARAAEGQKPSLDETLKRYVPIKDGSSEVFPLDAVKLARPTSEFQLQRRKVRMHHLSGIPGKDFVEAVAGDFQRLVSESRAFLDASVLDDETVRHLIRAGKAEGSPLRVLRDADRTRLERFALSTSLQSLERVSSLVDAKWALECVRNTLDRVGRVLDGEDNWVENIDLVFRLLRLAIGTRDWKSCAQLNERTEAMWGTVENLRGTIHALYHRERQINSGAAWVSLRNYLHERRLETVSGALPSTAGASGANGWLGGGLGYRTSKLTARALLGRARLLAASDLRARDREDDHFAPNPRDEQGPNWMAAELSTDPDLGQRLERIGGFVERCSDLQDQPWRIPAARLFLCTRPPSYFDIARRWLYRAESEGFEPLIFDALLQTVNAIRGTEYTDPVGAFIDKSTVAIPPSAAAVDSDEGRPDPRLVLGNFVVPPVAFRAAARGHPHLTLQRLVGLSQILAKTAGIARRRGASKSSTPTLLLLPELSLPRAWFRTVANHVVRFGGFGLVTGLEYRLDPVGQHVYNQVFAVLPGPFGSAATWPWTKRLPAHGEELELRGLKPPLRFPVVAGKGARTVVHSLYGRFSVLICSELIETRRTADLLGRSELILVPSWNTDTSSYDHLIQSVALQLHAVVAVANNGHFSDCRAWAPRSARWERELCRLIQRDVDDVVFVTIPIGSLRAFHAGVSSVKIRKVPVAEWRPLPPDWP